jgi:glucose 1-dehydrogenase
MLRGNLARYYGTGCSSEFGDAMPGTKPREIMRLKDKVALVTGASSGIGRAIATRFAADGAHVVVNYRPSEQLDAETAQAEAASFGPTALAIAADVSKREDVQRMMDQVLAEFGRIDIAVNNAGIEIKKPFLDVSDDE